MSDVHRIAATFGVHGASGALHHMGSHYGRCRHPWIHVGLRFGGVHHRPCVHGCFPQYRHWVDNDKAAARTLYEENRQGSFHLCLQRTNLIEMKMEVGLS